MVKTVTITISGDIPEGVSLEALKNGLKALKAKYPTLLIQVSETEAETY